MQFWYILDCMDGEVARYRTMQKSGSSMEKSSSLTGMYYDFINHYIVNLLVPATLGLGLLYKTGYSLFVGLGIVAALGQVLTLAMHDSRNRALMTYLRKCSRIEIIKPQASGLALPKERKGLAQHAFAVLHYTMTYPTVMNLTLLTAILELAFPAIPWRALLLLYLAIGSALVVTTIIGKTIAQGLLEKESESQFRILE